MIEIQPQYLSLSKLLEGRLFQIPDYQRAYSWGTHQRSDLFADIDKVHDKGGDASHFMAAVVGLRRRKQVIGTDEFHVMEIVDGQQRITTLIILLNVIKLRLDVDSSAEAKLNRDLSELLIKPEGEELLLLQTNHDSSHYFADFIREGKTQSPSSATTTADRQILQAIEECQEFVDGWLDGGESLVELLSLLKNRLHFLLHEIGDEQTVYTVFEVLNSRGLEVSRIDRLKSALMGKAFELENANRASIIDDLHVIWRDIYAVIGLRQGLNTEALRFAATLRASSAPSRPLSEDDSVDDFIEHATNGAEIRDAANWLLRVTKACDSILSNNRVNAVARISQARLLATAILLRDDFTKAQIESVLQVWERITFRIYGLLDKDARTRVGDYVRLAWDVVNVRLNPDEIATELENIGSEFSIEDAVAELRGADCYSDWQPDLRYLLFRYEEHLAANNGQKFQNEQWERIWQASAAQSIEHVWPQSSASEIHKHRLGNLLLLPPGLNSKLSDTPAKDKVDAYRKCGLFIAGEVADLIEHDGWKVRTIEQREDMLLDWISKEWGD